MTLLSASVAENVATLPNIFERGLDPEGIVGLGCLLTLAIRPSGWAARMATNVVAPARHAIGHCNHEETADDAALTDSPNAPDPATDLGDLGWKVSVIDRYSPAAGWEKEERRRSARRY
jgi:hypothetical protein